MPKTEQDAAMAALVPKMPRIGKDIDLNRYEFVPWEGRLVVRVCDPEEETPGGIILHDDAQEEKNWGRVAILPDGDPPGGLSIGDFVVFHLGVGEEIKALGDQYRILDVSSVTEVDILGSFRLKT